MGCLNRLAFGEAAKRAGVPLRTLRRWREEGLTVQRRGRALYVRLEDVLAWKRWKSLQDPGAWARRVRAATGGELGALVSGPEFERARAAWVAAGGRDGRA